MNLRFVTSDSESNSSFGWQKVSRNNRLPEIHITADMTAKIKQEIEAVETFESSEEEQLTISKKVISKPKKSNKQLNNFIKNEITSELESKIDESSEASDTNNKHNGTKRLSKNQLDFNNITNYERDLPAAESDDSDDNHLYSFQTNNSLSLFNGLETSNNNALDNSFEYKDVSYKDLLNRSKKELENDIKLITSSILKKDKSSSPKKSTEKIKTSTSKQLNISGKQHGDNNSTLEEVSLRKTTESSLHVNKDVSLKKVHRSISESKSPKKKSGITSKTSTDQYKNNDSMNKMFGISKDIFSESDSDNEENNMTMQSNTNKRVQSIKIDTYLETNDTLNVKNTVKFPGINITSDDEIWILQCPKTIDTNTLVDENLFDPENLQCIATKNDNADNSVSVVMGVDLISLKIKGNLLVKEKSKEIEENDVEVPIKSNVNVPFPNNFKTRHPLLGVNYKEKLHLSDDIKERFFTLKKNNCETISSSVLKTGEKRKKRKSVISDNKSEEPSPKKSKSKHTNQMWTTEDAIERNLFCKTNTTETVSKKDKKRKSIKNA